jgi:uncharacterized protein YjbJ (UPF0337 family)
MNWSTIQSAWPDYEKSVKKEWEKLTVEQVTGTLGKREHLSSRVQEAYNISKEESERQIAAWQERQRPAH